MKLAELVDIVADSRARTSAVFPLPDVPGCVDYAITELGEWVKVKNAYIDEAIVCATISLDAILRKRRNGDKRNNEKALDDRREWGQCGYMIASGLIQTGCDLDISGWMELDGTIYDVLSCLAAAVISELSLVEAMAEWTEYCNLQDWDAEKLLRETCAEFEHKHLQLSLLEAA